MNHLTRSAVFMSLALAYSPFDSILGGFAALVLLVSIIKGGKDLRLP